MFEIDVKIEGYTPLLCNKFTDAAQIAASTGTRAATVGDKGTPKEQAQARLYLSHDEKTLIIPQPNLLRCIIDAGKFHKAGKSKVTTMKTSLIPACVEIDGVEIPLLSKEGWAVDTRAVRIPSTGGRIQCHRPVFNDWSLEFTMRLDEMVIAEKVIRQIVDDAGQKIGLGDFRPDCKGPFGKFKVVKWEPKKLDDVEVSEAA